jgi:hypothetical protein
VLRAYDAAPFAPVWVGVIVVLVYLVLFVAHHNLTGVMDGLSAVDPSSPLAPRLSFWEVVNAVMVAFMLSAHVYAHRGAMRDLQQLRPALECSDERFAELVGDAACVPALSLHAASALGLLFGFLLATFDPGVWEGGVRPPMGDPIFLWVAFRNAVLGWCVARALAADLHLTRVYTRLGAESRIDLLDIRPLTPFARKGQRSAIIWLGFSVLLSLFWLGARPARINFAMLVVILCLVTGLFMAPLRGVHRRIARTKNAELDRVNQEIRRERASGAGAPGADPAGDTRLASLVAWRGLVEGVREWPVSASTLVRVAAFAVLGIGSWLGGAVVERILGLALD